MREIIQVQIGQCGNQLGCAFHEAIAEEHGIDAAGMFTPKADDPDPDLWLDGVEVYFRQESGGRYVPRTVLLDQDPGTMDMVRGGVMGQLYALDHFICGPERVGLGSGMRTSGAELVEGVLELVRKETEACDHLAAFQLVNSLGGITGGLLGSFVIDKMEEECPDIVSMCFAVLPSEASCAPAERINTVLSLAELHYNSGSVMCMENQVLHDTCVRERGLAHPTYADLNHLAATAMSHVTLPFRFSGPFNSDPNSMVTNLGLFPRLSLHLIGMAPLERHTRDQMSVHEMLEGSFRKKWMMVDCDPATGRCISSYVMFRGSFSGEEEEAIHMGAQLLRQRRFKTLNGASSNSVVPWIPDNIKTGIWSVPARGTARGVAYVANHTCIHRLIRRLLDSYHPLVEDREFVKYGYGEWDAREFKDYGETVSDLRVEYEMYGVSDEEEEFD